MLMGMVCTQLYGPPCQSLFVVLQPGVLCNNWPHLQHALIIKTNQSINIIAVMFIILIITLPIFITIITIIIIIIITLPIFIMIFEEKKTSPAPALLSEGKLAPKSEKYIFKTVLSYI